jgi:hypothetical protein
MKKGLLYLIVLLVTTGFNNSDPIAAWVVMQGSSLTVNGSTNVSNFQCEIADYSLPDTLTCIKSNKAQSLPMNGKLNLDIESFDCHNKMMTNDLRKTLKSKAFPKLTVRFISINSYPNFKTPTKIIGVVDIGLAGVVKRFEINYLFTQDDASVVHLKGNRNILFSEFNLIAPSKLGGVIKAKDELQVEFKLNLKPVG